MRIEEVWARRRFVFMDGAMGTELQKRGLQPGQKPELAALEMPQTLTAIHAEYAAAGAELLLANTFGANARKLAGSGHTVAEVVAASIACAKQAAAPCGALVGLDIGPLGELLAPAGTLPFADACTAFAEIVRAGAAAGADFVFIETMTDLYELKAAVLAAKENSDLPVFTSMSFEANGRTFTGCTVESYAVTAAGLGADAVGINVTGYKYTAILLGAAIAGLGGLCYVMDYMGGIVGSTVDQTIQGIGWLCIALVIFAMWKPAFAILGSIVFGALYILSSYIQGISFEQIPLLNIVPFAVTILVLIATSIVGHREMQPPASLGLSYFREDR